MPYVEDRGLNKTKPWLGMSVVSAFGRLRQKDDHETGARMGNVMGSRQAWAAECGSVQGWMLPSQGRRYRASEGSSRKPQSSVICARDQRTELFRPHKGQDGNTGAGRQSSGQPKGKTQVRDNVC